VAMLYCRISVALGLIKKYQIGGERMNKYIISVRNTANGKYENVEVAEEVYIAYMRTGWNIKDNDESFFKHQIQFSALLGNINDAAENFKEFINAVEDVAEITEKNLISEALKKVLKQLDQDERELIFLIFDQNKTEVECAEKYGISQQFINKKKKRILDKLHKLLKSYQF